MKQYETVFGLLKASLFGTAFTGTVTEEDYLEMQKHAVSALAGNALACVDMPVSLREKWKMALLRQVSHSVQYRHFQSMLPISVPYTILKGTSASQYYPYPEYRALGDIDLMPGREDFDEACRSLLQNGFDECTSHETEDLGRHRCFSKGGFMIEVHSFFAMLHDPAAAKAMDDLILANLTPSHVLPDLINGLVLLEHISQHLEVGLGIRQILDWMMFVDKCLPDQKWPDFRPLVQTIGLEALAKTVTRMCEMYLGLAHRHWCADAEEAWCRQLMEYVMASGNFGNKKKSDEDIVENVFVIAGSPGAAFRLLQERGLVNWKTARRFPILRPFAWLYQAGRYGFRGLFRKGAGARLNREYRAAKKRKAMFDALGIRQAGKGIVVYRDGKYVRQ